MTYEVCTEQGRSCRFVHRMRRRGGYGVLIVGVGTVSIRWHKDPQCLAGRFICLRYATLDNADNGE